MFNFLTRRSFSKALAVAAAFMTITTSPVVAKDPIKIAYLSPSFDISDAWEHVYWSLQGRLDELNVPYEIQSLAISSHVAHDCIVGKLIRCYERCGLCFSWAN